MTENHQHTIASSLEVRRTSEASGMTQTTQRAKAARISALLAQLAPQYYRPDFGPAQAQALFAAFVEDLEVFDILDIEQAIRAYRQDPKNKFFPTSGQIRALANAAAIERAKAERHRPVPTDTRPIYWWLLPVWKAHWRESEIPIAHVRAFEDGRHRRPEPKIIG